MKKKIQAYLTKTRKKIDVAYEKDEEYDTTYGNSVNALEAIALFEEVEHEIRKILNENDSM